ncbi:MAG: hypothetical protein Q9159_003782 [Coniocarpon cinnabarinum]
MSASAGPLEKRQEEEEAPDQLTEPAWISSPLWALYSYSADLYPPPTASDPPLPEATENPSQMVTAMATTAATSGFSTMTSPATSSNPSTRPLSSTFDTVTLSKTTDSQTSALRSTTATTSSGSSSSSSSLTSSTSAPASISPAPAPHHGSDSHTTAIVVGVLVPVISLVILAAIILLFLRHRRAVKGGKGSQSGESRFEPTSSRGTSVALLAGLGVGFKKTKSNSRGLLSNASPTEMHDEKDPPAYDPPITTRHPTTILTAPGRLPSPSRHAEVQEQRPRANSEAAMLTDGSSDDVQDLDFHCEGNSSRTSGDTARFLAGLPSGSPTGAGAFNGPSSASRPQRQGTQRSQGSSWLSTSSMDSGRNSRRPSVPAVPQLSPVPAQAPLINVTSPPPALRNVNDNTSSHWWTHGSRGLDFDSYHPGIQARDFALGNYSQETDRRSSAARSSLSLSSGPWSDSDDDDTAEVPLTRGSDVVPGTAS